MKRKRSKNHLLYLSIVFFSYFDCSKDNCNESSFIVMLSRLKESSKHYWVIDKINWRCSLSIFNYNEISCLLSKRFELLDWNIVDDFFFCCVYIESWDTSKDLTSKESSLSHLLNLSWYFDNSKFDRQDKSNVPNIILVILVLNLEDIIFIFCFDQIVDNSNF